MDDGPRISFVRPEGWQFKEQVTLMSTPGAAGGVPANVIVGSEPLTSDLTTESYAEMMDGQAREEFPNYREITVEPMTVFGRDAMLRRFEWEPEKGQRVTQLQVYLVHDEHVYTVTATVESEHFEACRDELMTILNALSLAPAQDAAAAPAA